MTIEEARTILADVRYLDWQFHVGDDGGRPYFQLRFDAPSGHGGPLALQHARKWLMSPFMTRSEVVQTALLAVLTAVEHEARERFHYKGEALFGPHFDVEGLVGLCRSANGRELRA